MFEDSIGWSVPGPGRIGECSTAHGFDAELNAETPPSSCPRPGDGLRDRPSEGLRPDRRGDEVHDSTRLGLRPGDAQLPPTGSLQTFNQQQLDVFENTYSSQNAFSLCYTSKASSLATDTSFYCCVPTKEQLEHIWKRVWKWLDTSPGLAIDQDLLGPFPEIPFKSYSFLQSDHQTDTSSATTVIPFSKDHSTDTPTAATAVVLFRGHPADTYTATPPSGDHPSDTSTTSTARTVLRHHPTDPSAALVPFKVAVDCQIRDQQHEAPIFRILRTTKKYDNLRMAMRNDNYIDSQSLTRMAPLCNRNVPTPGKTRGRGLSVGDALREQQELPPFEEPLDDVPAIPEHYLHERNDSVSSYIYGGPSAAAAAQQEALRQEQSYLSQQEALRQEQSYISQGQSGGVASRTYRHDRNTSASSSRAPQQGPIPERGRTLQKKQDPSKHEVDEGLSPVSERGDVSDITTMSDFIHLRNGASGARSMSRHKSPPKAATTGRKGKNRPEPLDLKDVRRYAALVGPHANIHPVHHPVTPMQAEYGRVLEDGSSVYDDAPNVQSNDVYDAEPNAQSNDVYDATPKAQSNDDSPIREPHNRELAGVSVLERYSEWRNNAPISSAAVNGSMEPRSNIETPNAPIQAEQGPSPAKAKGAMLLPTPVELNAPPFTPLTPFIEGGNARKVSKTMIGENGWLENTAAGAVKKPERQKSSSFFGNVKKTARKIATMADFKTAGPKALAAREIAISLDPREQSLLYCEMGFILSNAMSGYINAQLHSGRLNPHILARISDLWGQQGRPKVVGFRYDLETQVDLVTAHVGTFRFYGPDQTNQVLIKALLYDMKMDARVMRVQTYCQPDSVIAKHILDSQRLLQLLDTPEQMQISLAEVSQFFKVAIEREDAKRAEKETEKTEKTVIAPTPPQTVNAKGKGKGKAPALVRDSSPENYPGAQRVKNQASVPESQRQFSGPVLEPTTYDQPKSLRHRQDDQRRHPGF
ncbi:hypothetical protein Hte_003874 [Hypoxylon texense]